MRRILLQFVTLFLLAAAAYGQQAFPSGQVGVPYQYNMPGCLGNPNCADPYLTAGALPPGLSFGSGATVLSIIGIPTQAGVFYFTVEGGQNIGPASITILPGPPAIVPEILPNAAVGVPYNATLSATGEPLPTAGVLRAHFLRGFRWCLPQPEKPSPERRPKAESTWRPSPSSMRRAQCPPRVNSRSPFIKS